MGGCGQQRREQRDGGQQGRKQGDGGQQGREQGSKGQDRGIGGGGADPLPPLPVLRPCCHSNLKFISDLKRHDLNCQVTCCSFIITTCLDTISIIVVARCHDKINKFHY